MFILLYSFTNQKWVSKRGHQTNLIENLLITDFPQIYKQLKANLLSFNTGLFQPLNDKHYKTKGNFQCTDT